MRLMWDVAANDGLSMVPAPQRGAVRDHVVQWANGAANWGPGRQSTSFRASLYHCRAEAEFAPPDQVTIHVVEID